LKQSARLSRGGAPQVPDRMNPASQSQGRLTLYWDPGQTVAKINAGENILFYFILLPFFYSNLFLLKKMFKLFCNTQNFK